jgi:hypothetical protein
VTRVTASNAADAAADCIRQLPGSDGSGGVGMYSGGAGGGGGGAAVAVPFVFVSAAEAKWTFKAPVVGLLQVESS